MLTNNLQYKQHSLLVSTAKDLQYKGYNYQESILKMQSIKMFSNWDEWEVCNRPVDINEIEYILADIEI